MKSKLFTLAIIVAYIAVMVSSNSHFTILDDESIIIAFAGNKASYYFQSFLSGHAANEHPPLSDFLLHLWLVATNYSFFMLRVFANIFYIAGILLTSIAAQRVAGKGAYWATLALGVLWPFAFQYGRITGWYCFCLFLVAWLTCSYVKMLEDENYWPWGSFGIAAVAIVWSNYFGVAVLVVFLADIAIFHRKLVAKHPRLFTVVAAVITVSLIPLLKAAVNDQLSQSTPVASVFDLKNAIATFGYPFFSIFGSVAVAPWFLPLSIPILVCLILLLVSIWHSPGRRWFIYFVLAIALLQFSGHITIKRVIFLFPWLLLAMGVTLSSQESRYPRLAATGVAGLIIAGWIGIISGRHYATTNLYEPWAQVASVVESDARRGATIVSDNYPFFLYLDYQLGLQSSTQGASSPYLSESLYRAHGYAILLPENLQAQAVSLHGAVVLVNGSGIPKEVAEQGALNDALRQRCSTIGEYNAAPDPALLFKAKFVKDAPILAYRTNVVWYHCPY